MRYCDNFRFIIRRIRFRLWISFLWRARQISSRRKWANTRNLELWRKVLKRKVARQVWYLVQIFSVKGLNVQILF